MTNAAYACRFRWPMRLFLCFYVTDMVMRSLLSLSGYDRNGWCDELCITKYPKSLPYRAELDGIAAGKNAEYSSARERYWACVTDVGRFYNPIPSPNTAAELDNAESCAKYAIAWTASRLNFIGVLVGVDQDWPMFSPNVGRTETLGRLRMIYADGTQRVWHTLADPVDVTHYYHWPLEEKRLQATAKIERDYDARISYCRWLAYEHPRNEAGSPLVRIEVFRVNYEYPQPGDDAAEFLAAQRGPPAESQDPPFAIFDVATGEETKKE